MKTGYQGSALLSILALLVTPFYSLRAEQRRTITVKDCVRTRRIVEQEVQISQDGTKVAYIVKAPDVVNNRNNYQLYVHELAKTEQRDNGQLLLDGVKLSHIRWLNSGQIAVRVERKMQGEAHQESELDIVDPSTRSFEKIKFPTPMVDYSISVNGEVVVFSSVAATERSEGAQRQQKNREERGYRVAYGDGSGGGIDQPPQYNLFLGRRKESGNLDVQQLFFSGPGSAPRRSSLSWVEHLNLSPDGKYLLLNYSADALPNGWEDQPLVKQLKGFGTRAETHLLGLYEIATGQLRVAFNYLGVFLVETRWSDDSRAYSVVSPSPFGTPEATKEAAAAEAFGNPYRYMYRFKDVFAVEVRNLTVKKVFSRNAGEQGTSEFLDNGPLYWRRSDGEMIVTTGTHLLALVALRSGEWEQIDGFEIPEDGRFESSINSNGQLVVAISQSPMTPPNLVLWDFHTKQTSLLTDLNPEYQEIALGRTEMLEWTNRYGSKCAGLLIRPLDYEKGKRYPMVFLAAPVSNDFISDSRYTTAYAPQPLANAGFVVLLAQYPLDNEIQKGQFPGEMNDAYNWMAMVESAVDLLSDRGLVDKTKIGIGGFSRTSWLAGFTITHSTYSFHAASLADSALGSYGQYYKYNSLLAIRGAESQIGGPPYGPTFDYWLKYANPFNADRAKAAVLMEFTPPIEDAYEFFVALARQGKPVELYYYPKGAHPLDTPFERVASLQRNVDWFRFWLKGEEDADPTKAEQYTRWRELRRLQQTDKTGQKSN
jgi:dipeptidyl aminopeptidase/acylaminoacyl peptidase